MRSRDNPGRGMHHLEDVGIGYTYSRVFNLGTAIFLLELSTRIVRALKTFKGVLSRKRKQFPEERGHDHRSAQQHYSIAQERSSVCDDISVYGGQSSHGRSWWKQARVPRKLRVVTGGYHNLEDDRVVLSMYEYPRRLLFEPQRRPGEFGIVYRPSSHNRERTGDIGMRMNLLAYESSAICSIPSSHNTC
ncbi:uncharacterized protein H6S33_003494 [Morchella sextelata]|uniref:uncharacterized protein n=1 Tax=Morchella sextelata TaxID=1174677 RepID=UPI001D057BCA|nr:uncharacterized protein H6S33_003494 [Morchella sextelata]KAH0606660.1 hypothetical protein H6S33_003494 [Morchella sextelata]